MTTSNYVIRAMSHDEINIAIDWAALEGWNPGLYDADCFYAADPQGFLIGALNDEPIATISAVKYGQTFGFIGFYIVKPPYRGKGYGIQIWNAALQYLSGRNIGLDGVVAQQSNYKKSGFQLSYRNIRFAGVSSNNESEMPGIVSLSEVPFDSVVDYDRPFFPDSRETFLHAWIHQPASFALGILDKGKIAGYGVIRTCQTGYKIGPLIAENKELANTLFVALTSKVPSGEPVYLDVPEINQDAVFLVQKHEMQLVFETARMYTASSPELPHQKIFGVTSFELG